MSTMLEVEGLRVDITTRRGTLHVVRDVSFGVQQGRAMGLVGESGSGKSVTLRAVLGLLPHEAKVTAGRITVDGVDITAASPRRLREIHGPLISMVFQEPMTALNPVMRVGEQIAEGPRTHLGLSRSQAHHRAIELMRRVGIPDPERRSRAYPHEFSGGMRQRVMIAIALSCEPKVILCDEPTTALDVTVQEQILQLLRGLSDESGTTLLFVTHDLPVVAQLCQTVGVMYSGTLLEQGTVAEVFREPRHPYTLGLLRSAPDFEDERVGLQPILGSPPDPLTPPPGCAFQPRCELSSPDCSTGEFPLVDLGGRASACRYPARVADVLVQ